jgi:hypothetical protein
VFPLTASEPLDALVSSSPAQEHISLLKFDSQVFCCLNKTAENKKRSQKEESCIANEKASVQVVSLVLAARKSTNVG